MKLSLDIPTYDPTARTAQPKPSKLPRKVAQHEAKKARQAEKDAEERQERARQTKLRRQVFNRDKGVSRFSGVAVKWTSENPAELGHRHHIVFRSLGGSDELSNLVLLSPAEHDMAHARHPKFVLDIAGDANQTLTFTKRHVETGQVVETKESPCP